ncbi:hypothetical protein ZWY2020_040933 [Hordeum vulgare]|nr:hypothetical protein ZWY2020_040933 [Hordeum vulgare]
MILKGPIYLGMIFPLTWKHLFPLRVETRRENEEIVPMRAMKMAWVPYVPLEDRLTRIDSLKKIFTLGCTQRRSALKHLKEERVNKFDYSTPFEEGATLVTIQHLNWCHLEAGLIAIWLVVFFYHSNLSLYKVLGVDRDGAPENAPELSRHVRMVHLLLVRSPFDNQSLYFGLDEILLLD